MKPIITTGLLCAVFGATVGWMNAADHYEAKASKEQAAYSKALAEVNQRAEHYQSISEEYYADYQDAINREHTVVRERVFVKVHCPTNAEAKGGTDTARAVTPAGIAAIMSTHKNNALAHGLVGAGGVGTYLLTGSSATEDPTPWGFGYAGTWENLTVNSTQGSTLPDYIPLIEHGLYGRLYGKVRLWRRTL